MRTGTYSGPVRGLCSLPELFEALLLFLPAGVALGCIETALAAGLYVEKGEVLPGRSEASFDDTQRHFPPWLPRRTPRQYTQLQRMCDPLGVMGGAVQVTHLLAMHSDVIARNALERGWLSEEDFAQIREPRYREPWDDLVAALNDGTRADDDPTSSTA